MITDDFFQRSFPSWNVEPQWASFLGPFSEATSLAVVYRMATSHYPKNTFSQYNTIADGNQRLYFVAMGGKQEDWPPRMKASVDSISSAAPNFHS